MKIKASRKKGPGRGAPGRKRGPRSVSMAGEHVYRAQGYITPEEAAELTGAAKPTVYGWAKRGALGQANPTPEYQAVVKAPDARTWLLRAAVLALRPAASAASAGG